MWLHIPKICLLGTVEVVKICRDWFRVFGVLGLSKPIIQPTQLGFGLSLDGVWQKQCDCKSCLSTNMGYLSTKIYFILRLSGTKIKYYNYYYLSSRVVNQFLPNWSRRLACTTRGGGQKRSRLLFSPTFFYVFFFPPIPYLFNLTAPAAGGIIYSLSVPFFFFVGKTIRTHYCKYLYFQKSGLEISSITHTSKWLQ